MRIDWIAAGLTWIGNVVLIRKKSWYCFVIFFGANLLWTFHWLARREWAALILVSTFMVQNIWGIISWRRRDGREGE